MPGKRASTRTPGLAVVCLAVLAFAHGCGLDLIGTGADDVTGAADTLPITACGPNHVCMPASPDWNIVVVVGARGGGDGAFAAAPCPEGWAHPRVGIAHPHA